MADRHGKHQRFAIDHAQPQIARVLGVQRLIADKTDVDVTGQQRSELRFGVHLAQLQAHVRSDLPVTQQRLRQRRMERDGRRISQAQLSAMAFRSRDDVAARLIGLGQNLPRLFQKNLAGLGQGDVALVALEQSHAQILFQRLDLLR